MTPKEKALQIYSKFRNYAPVLEANARSKRNALILANEIVHELSDLPRIPFNENRTKYWEDVRNEIEKL